MLSRFLPHQPTVYSPQSSTRTRSLEALGSLKITSWKFNVLIYLYSEEEKGNNDFHLNISRAVLPFEKKQQMIFVFPSLFKPVQD